MAPRATSKSKGHKAKGEKKKKEDKLLPTVLDVLINLPSGDEIILKGISTDRILDVRKLLAVNVDTCHLTRFSLSHQIRGDRLSDSQEIVHLKPCVLTLVEEPYTEELAVDHVRRLLDLVSCISCFGPSADRETEAKTGRADTAADTGINLKDIKDITKLCPPSQLGKFYEFFSFAHLKSPLQSIRLSRAASGPKSDFFSLEVKVTNGKSLCVTACGSGFYHAGKQQVKCHELVDLLRHLSKSFNDNYEDLMKAFSERNKFANIPYGLRANTWVVPPVAAESPSTFPSLPAEDEAWGGDGGGQGRKPESLSIPWSQHFSMIARMPCETSEEREVRDHKAFVLHNYFVDVATTNAVALVRELDSSGSFRSEHVENRGTLKFSVTRDSTDPSRKVFWKIESHRSTSEIQGEVSERNLLKGITADESTVVHDTCTLGVVLVRYQGYKVVVEVVPSEQKQELVEIMDPPEGGANALNANSLRILLHKKSPKHDTNVEETKSLLSKRIEEPRFDALEQQSEYFRWELGACWVQHLGETTKAKSSEKAENSTQEQNKEETDQTSPLKGFVSESSLEKLRATKSGLHLKSVAELMKEAEQYYSTVALPKLVSDFSALELSPVEGRTLTDFMHIRGLRISSLGHLADLCSKLPHIRSLCIHEMIIRAFKHLLRAVIASVEETSELAPAIATAMNSIFSSLPAEGRDEPADEKVWKWLESFVLARFRWKLSYDLRLNLRKYALLRGICYKVGIEMAPRNYDFSSSAIFTKEDVLSLVPVYKHAICSSADGRTLLESSKAALDKGKLEEAVTFGSKALTKLIAVCGPYHRMTAGAYSLLAVVLYHTGDFNQAMIYQQKALDINERELGLDHPDTMKSYGDLAVFYYRLQHTELALRYVNRALYLLHLICGPSHPNTAATYINVAMMEEALGNAHVALRYLHEALKCNERLLGKDHIQTAASYHAIAIALSLMEAYTLSVHHEQTTYQILQAKLGPDDIRTQDAAAWLDYFDSKAVEQQEAARTGAPKPDPSVASKGHLSVSDLLDFINKEVSRSNDKDTKRPKRLKVLAIDDAVDQLLEQESTADAPAEAPAQSVPTENKNQVDPVSVAAKVQEPKLDQILQPDQVLVPEARENHRAEISTSVARQSEEFDEDEGWLEATSKGKHHRKLLQRRRSFAGAQASSSSFRMTSATARPVTPTVTSSQQDKQEERPSSSSGTGVAEEVHSIVVPKLGRSYKDVALTPARSAAEAAAGIAAAKAAAFDAEEDSVSNCEASSNCSSASLSAAARPYSPSAAAMQQTGVKAGAAKAGSGLGHPDAQQQTTVAVAVTPIRKQVHIPSKTPALVFQAPAIPSPPPPPPPTQPAQASSVAPGSPSHSPSPTTPGKKLMNPFATEFVPGRKWHPVDSSGTNAFQAGGSSRDQDQGQEKQGQGRDGGVSAAAENVEQADFELVKGTSSEEKDAEAETEQERSNSEAVGIVEAEKELQDFEAAAIAMEGESFAAVTGLEQDQQSGMSELGGIDSGLSTVVMSMTMKRSWSSSNSGSSGSSARYRSRARWQRRSDGAITRVYRLQGGNSSANPQLKTTSTFSDVPEPHTLQPSASSTVMRSVQVS